MERLEALGYFTRPTLSQLEDALDLCLQFTGTVVTADLWDAGRLIACEHCAVQRLERLRLVNATGRAHARIPCIACRES